MIFTRRPIVWSIAGLSLVTLLVSSYVLALRIEAFHADHERDIFFFVRTDRPQFTHAGHNVSFVPDLDDEGEGTVTVTFVPQDGSTDGETLVLPVEIPGTVPLPGLERFNDWLGVFFFADSGRRLLGEFREMYKAGELPLRCVIVVRDPNPGVGDEARFDLEVEPDNWGFGEVMRNRWTFRFYELLEDGTIERSERVMPESGASFYRRQVRAYQRGEAPPERAENELREGTWRWDAALQLMPRPPAITKENQALVYAGWTLPVASLSALGLLLGVAFGLAPDRVQRNETATSEPPAAS